MIFGFMFGDVGQGLIILIAGLVLGRRIPLMKMLVPGGIMAIVFGFLFGSVFCREDIIPALWMRPLADPITVLIAAVVAGVAIISIGLLLDALQMHWRGRGAALVGSARRPCLGLCRTAGLAAADLKAWQSQV